MILLFLCVLKKKNLRTNIKMFYLEKYNGEITLYQAS